MRAEMISREVRRRYFYTVEDAGMRIGLRRSMAYLAVARGQMPVVRFGRLMLVPRRKWDEQVKVLLRGDVVKPRRKTAA